MFSGGRYGFKTAAILILLLCLVVFSALSETKIELLAGQWTWEAGGTSSLNGVIVSDLDLTDAVLTLDVKTRLENSGEVVFTSLNGKKVKIRKQAPSIESDLVKGTETPFEAEWTLPEDIDGGIGWAVISLKVTDSEGIEIASASLEVGSRAEEEALIESSPDRVSRKVLTGLLIAAAVVWILAFTRSIILNRNRKDH